MENWVSILKQQKPSWSAFFNENDITAFIKDAIRKEKEDVRKYGLVHDQVIALAKRYGISDESAKLITRSHRNDAYEPIVDINSYNLTLRRQIEARQRAKLAERNTNRPPRRKGQRNSRGR